jgi:hypothetical protein
LFFRIHFVVENLRQALEEKKESILNPSQTLTIQKIGAGIQLPPEQRRLFSLGLLSKQECQIVMSEVYRALKMMGVRWMVLNAYKVKIRFEFGDESVNDKSPPKSRTKVVRIGLQMYKLNEHEHMLDIQKLSGDILHFLEFCSSFFQEFDPKVYLVSSPSSI